MGLNDAEPKDELSEAAVLIDLILLSAAHVELRYEDNEEMHTWLDRFQDKWLGPQDAPKQKPDAENGVQGPSLRLVCLQP
ncbi:hypothetical protein D8Y22_02085 [Salinadaptatus halalkaliphilus]|uniref:Uncharacterized protein n=1 Tax=Salinadaptatus halalkaliphilus TaxID=2419781 RepID=A0A4S3TUW6_9EURY|nr:hypothetical protein D8Y22_02085 [Salinadaptatus halalkaliphilus]